MKLPLPSALRLGLLFAALVAGAAAAEQPAPAPAATDADRPEATNASIKFSDATKPGTLKVYLPWADVRVTGTDAAEVSVTSNLAEHGKPEARNDGLRRLDQEQSFILTEKNNVATLRLAGAEGWGPQGTEFRIALPRHAALVLHTEMGGDISVENVDGDIEISSMNGEVTLKDIGSSAVVNTMNGEVHASFKTAPAKPVSLSSMNGEIDLRLPADTKANLRMRSHNGALLTDFPEGVLKTKSETRTGHASHAGIPREAAQAMRDAAKEAAQAARDAAKAAREDATDKSETDEIAGAPVAPLPPVPPEGLFGGKSIVGTLNGGGVDITLATMNGTITVRQLK
jgi:hypothetical protein